MDTAHLKTLGQRLRQRRRSLSLSQEELGHRSGVDRSYISGLERGVRNPTFSILSQLADAMGCGLTDLFRDMDSGGDAAGGAGGAGGGDFDGTGLAESLRHLWRAEGE